MFITCLVSSCNGRMTFDYSVEELNARIIPKQTCLAILSVKELKQTKSSITDFLPTFK